MVKVGIPRALDYYKYFPLWKVFFTNLGVEVVVSPPTNKKIVDYGVKNTVDEVCMPVKTYLGHVCELKKKVDYLFIPRIVSVHKGEYTCPKVMGLPDIVKANVNNLPKVISPIVDLTKKDKNLHKDIWEVGSMFSKNPLKVINAWHEGIKALKEYRYDFQCEKIPSILNMSGVNKEEKSLKIAVIGHDYILYDPYISMNLLNKLAKYNINVYTPEMIDKKIINEEVNKLPKRIFWDFAKDLLGTTFYLGKRTDIDGFIHISSFGCGPDAMTTNAISTYLKQHGKPNLELTIDEQTGEAGVNTRLEAFYDLLTRKVG